MSPTTAWSLALITALSWSALDALRKRLSTDLDPVALAALLAAGGAPPLAIWWWLDGAGLPVVGWLGPGSAILAANVVATVLFQWSLTVSPLSVTVPMLSLTPALGVAIAAVWLGEVPTPTQLGGIGFIVCGALVMPQSGRLSAVVRHFFYAFVAERGVLGMIGVAVLWSFTATGDKAAQAYAAIPAHATLISVGIAVILGIVLAARGRLHTLREARKVPLLVVATMGAFAAAIGLQVLTLSVLLVGEVEGLKRAVGLILAVVVGRAWFREAINVYKITGAALLCVGVILLAA